MNRLRNDLSGFSASSVVTETAQVLEDDDHCILLTWWENRIFLSIPSIMADSFAYSKIKDPCAMDCFPVQGRQGKPKVKRSESDLIPTRREVSFNMFLNGIKVLLSALHSIPGYLNKLHVPPISWRLSKMQYERSGWFCCRRYAKLMPEMPAPMMMTSKSTSESFAIVQKQIVELF